MTHVIVLLPGDGIGPEIVHATRRVIEALNLGIRFEEVPFGAEAYERNGDLMLGHVQQLVDIHKVALKGPTRTPTDGTRRSFNIWIREAFKLNVNIRPLRTIKGIVTRWSDVAVDIVIFRENLGGLYWGEEWVHNGVAKALAVYDQANIRNFMDGCFVYMTLHGRKRVVVGGKPNINPITQGKFFVDIAKEQATRFSAELGKSFLSTLLTDDLSRKAVQHPEQFDCIILPNEMGDVLSEAFSAFVGGPGVAPGANVGGTVMVCEAMHGTADDIAGRDLANPTACMLSGAMAIDRLGYAKEANRLRKAIDRVYAAGIGTVDIFKERGVSLTSFTDSVISAL